MQNIDVGRLVKQVHKNKPQKKNEDQIPGKKNKFSSPNALETNEIDSEIEEKQVPTVIK